MPPVITAPSKDLSGAVPCNNSRYTATATASASAAAHSRKLRGRLFTLDNGCARPSSSIIFNRSKDTVLDIPYLDHSFVGHVLNLLRHYAWRGANVDVSVAGQFGKTRHGGLAVVTSGGLRAHKDAYIRAAGDRSFRVLVEP